MPFQQRPSRPSKSTYLIFTRVKSSGMYRLSRRFVRGKSVGSVHTPTFWGWKVPLTLSNRKSDHDSWILQQDRVVLWLSTPTPFLILDHVLRAVMFISQLKIAKQAE